MILRCLVSAVEPIPVSGGLGSISGGRNLGCASVQELRLNRVLRFGLENGLVIVRCINILSSTGDELTAHDSMTVGAEYVVIAVVAVPGHDVLLRVIERGTQLADLPPGVPALWRSQMFEVVSPSIPTSWAMEIRESGGVEIGPASWLRLGFWFDLIDATANSDEALADYHREVGAMLSEAAV